MAGWILVRCGRFNGRLLFNSMIYAPLVIPEVVIGLALLLMFIALSINRGYWTVTVAHATFSMCYVAVVIQSRLASFDRSLEEAAMDLGCPPLKTFFVITLPVMLPAVLSAWLLSFTLSIDDLVIASFTTGPGATTLPMRIFSQMRLGVTPQINAISTLFIGLVATTVTLSALIRKFYEQKTRG
jgi:putrescine transport system permease protein